MNDLGYGQLSYPNRSLKLILIRVGNHRELLWYFHYLGQGFHHISIFESISSNIEGKWSYRDCTIIFMDFLSHLIYNILDIPWLGIRKSLSKHDHWRIETARCLWCLRSKDHIHNHDMNQLDWNFGIITIQGFIWINWVNYFFKERTPSILSVSPLMATWLVILIIWVGLDCVIPFRWFDVLLEYPTNRKI